MINSICTQYLETDRALREEHDIINGMLNMIQEEDLTIEQINRLEAIRFAEQRLMKLAKALLNKDMINEASNQIRGANHA